MSKQKIISTNKPPSNFLIQADTDYLVSRLLFICGAGFFNLSAYHSQQSLEKYIKAFTVQEANKYLMTHDLEMLRMTAVVYNNYFSSMELANDLSLFNVYDQVTRYGVEATYDPHCKKNESIEIAASWSFGAGSIKVLDRLVYKIRGLLDFDKIKHSDTLRAILQNQTNDMIVGTWKLGIPIKFVLTQYNDYYKIWFFSETQSSFWMSVSAYKY